MEQAIKIAAGNGWRYSSELDWHSALGGIGNQKCMYAIAFDPLFWQALGKGVTKIHWDGVGVYREGDVPGFPSGGRINEREVQWGEFEWKEKWHNLIDHLAEGKDIDSFFTDLIQTK